MPYKDKEVEKVYYPIGEVASIFGVNTSLIRFWEKEFDVLKPKKNKKGKIKNQARNSYFFDFKIILIIEI